MLIRFTCENFLSFTEETEFLNTANTRSIKLKDHIIRSKPSHIPILKGTAIYGANASGKSNFLEAIIFSKNIVASYKKDITDHRISSHQSKFSQTSDSKFEYEFKSENLVFRYGFIINQTQVKAEWLYQKSIVATSAEKTIFTRENQIINHQEEIKNIIKKETNDNHFFDYCAKGLRPEQLFLHKLKDNNIKFVDQIFDWFQSIAFITPSTTLVDIWLDNRLFFAKPTLFIDFLKKTLHLFDHQIADISLDEIAEINKPTDIKNCDDIITLYDILKTPTERDYFIPIGKYFFIKEEGKIKQQQLFIIRNGQKFSLQEESMGINRLLDLTMILSRCKNTIWLIDELENSLHPYLAKLFIKMFFHLSKNNENQLIFTTHLPYLLNLDLLRKDEIWFVEKDKNMNSIIKSLAEYKFNDAKNGLDIEKQYLQGRFGVVPFISSSFFE
jgi:AAA15 family ATPase/GTPase